MIDRRSLPRYAVQIEGKLISPDLLCCTDVVVHDLSEDGALVRASTPVAFPERGYLWQARTGTLFECQIRWRKNDRLFGLRFTDPAGRARRRALIAACGARPVQVVGEGSPNAIGARAA
jgi:hypothetical protein